MKLESVMKFKSVMRRGLGVLVCGAFLVPMAGLAEPQVIEVEVDVKPPEMGELEDEASHVLEPEVLEARARRLELALRQHATLFTPIFLGLEVAPLEGELGLRVVSVEADSPAAGAGLEVDDVVLKLDDQWLVNAEQMAKLSSRYKAGDEVEVTYRRGEAEETATLAYAERQAEDFAGAILNLLTEEEKAELPPGYDAFMKRSMVEQLAEGVEPGLTVYGDGFYYETSKRDGVDWVKITDEDGNVVYDGLQDEVPEEHSSVKRISDSIQIIPMDAP